ncbi:hypothetical protein Tco_0566166 [Tanacetum coccineum]
MQIIGMVGTMDVLTRRYWLVIPETMMEKEERGREAAVGMTRVEFKVLLMEEFCPSNEMEKLESEFWNHIMVGANHAGLAPQIRGMLRETQPTTIQNVILKAGILTDEAVRCGTLTRSSEKGKKVEETSKQGGL